MFPRFLTSAAVAAFTLMTASCRADPGYYVVTVYDDPGLRSLDIRYWTFEQHGQPTTVWPEFGVGYNVNGPWYTELYASWIGSSRDATRVSSWNWQNDVLLTRGQYPFDLAVHAQYVHQPHDPDAIEVGPVFQTDVGRTQLNGNLFFEHHFGGDEPTELKYQWQVRHRWIPGLHFGAQGFGELGRWNRWSDTSHRAGPAVFGNVPLGGRTAFSWQAAYLFGETYGQRGRMFTMQAKLNF